MLTREEGLLRHPATGSPDIANHPNEWHVLSPRYRDERLIVGGLAVLLAGPALLADLSSFAGTSAVLEVGILADDGLGGTRDLSATTAHVIENAREWGGQHVGTFVDAEAARYRDGSGRAGLRGSPAVGVPSEPARWTSDPIDLRYGTEIEAAAWEAELLRDRFADVIAPPEIQLRTGTRAASGAITWGTPVDVAATAAEISAGRRELDAALAGEVFRWQVTLPYSLPDVASPQAVSLPQTAVMFMLAAWIRMHSSRWRFASLAELIERSELSRHAGEASWQDGDDAIILRMPLDAALRGGRGEQLRARLLSDSGTALTTAEICAVANLGFDALDG